MQRVAIEGDGGRVSALRRDGVGAGIVFLHGLCGGAIHFDRAFSTTSLAGIPLLAVDLPGFGQSLLQPNLDAMAGAVRVAIVASGFERPLLVAHSMASSIAMRLLPATSGIVLLEGNLFASHLDFSDRIIGVPEADFRIDYARMQRTSKIILRYQTSITDDAVLARYAATWRECAPETVWRVAEGISKEVRAGRVAEAYAQADVPLTCVYGAIGAYAKSVPDIASRLPAARLVAIEKSAHYPMLDAPDATYAAVAGAYKEIVPNA